MPVVNGALPPPPGCSLHRHNAPQCPVLDPLPRGFTSGEVRLAFEVRSAAVRLELLGTLYTFCRYGSVQCTYRMIVVVTSEGPFPCQYFPHKCEGCEDGTPQNLPAQHSSAYRTHEKQAPQVLGIAASELESSAAQYNKQASGQARKGWCWCTEVALPATRNPLLWQLSTDHQGSQQLKRCPARVVRSLLSFCRAGGRGVSGPDGAGAAEGGGAGRSPCC